MKIYCLGLNPTSSCYLLKFRNIKILLDCGLELLSVLRFLPNDLRPTFDVPSSVKEVRDPGGSNLCFYEINSEIFINSRIKFSLPNLKIIEEFMLDEIDVILISNPFNMLALPFITEYTKFRGEIYATEPTVQIGKQFMLELVEYVNASYMRDNPIWQREEMLTALPTGLLEQLGGSLSWKSIYSKSDVENSVNKIKGLSFCEHVNIALGLQAYAASSGFCLGGANWIIKTHAEKIVYLADTSLQTTKHPEKLNIDEIKNPDVLIATKLNTEPNLNVEQSTTDFFNSVAHTVANGGNVLIPSYAYGAVWDLLDQLHIFLGTQGLHNTPIYFLSPASEFLFAYSTIIGEWLCKPKQEKLYVPESPFSFEDNIKSQKLIHMSSISDPKFTAGIRQPCIVFAGHPSLRLGPVIQFLRMWGKQTKSSLVFIDPAFNHKALLAPFEISMKIQYFPIDTRLSLSEANNLIKDLKPKHLVIPHSYSTQVSPRNSLQNPEGSVSVMKNSDVVNIPLKPKYQPAFMTQELALNLHPRQVGDFSIANIDAILITKDDEIKLDVVKEPAVRTTKRKRLLSGRPSPERIIEALQERGIDDIELETTGSETLTVSLPSLKATLTLSPYETTINTENESSRLLLKELLIQMFEVYG